MTNALKNIAREARTVKTQGTPQTVRTPGRNDEVRNDAGGFVFKVSPKDQLERFLILGTDNGTYYVSENDLTKRNLDFVKNFIKSDYRMVVDTLADVAGNNRAAKNSPSLYTLALLASAEGGDKVYLRESGVFDKVVRTSTHLFEFANYIDSLGGWGRSKRNLIAGWYTGKDAGALAYQAVKYRQREGWTHRDLFRKVHPTGVDNRVGNFILGKPEFSSSISEDTKILHGFALMQESKSVADVVKVLGNFKNLPWETIPTQFLNDAKVWKTLFYNGALGQTALLRNITRLAKLGAFSDLVFVGDVANALADPERIAKGRVHPVAYANALSIYRKGTPSRNAYGSYYGGYAGGFNKDWTENAKIAGALEAGFYASFKTIVPANKPTFIGLDVSGSMGAYAPSGLAAMNCREASAIMAMVTLRTEPYTMVGGFTSTLKELPLSEHDSLETVVRKISGLSFGATDCSAPMAYAKKRGIDIDTFVVYTDNDTWAGNVKPNKALVNYRQATGRDARLAVVGMMGNEFTIADPTDRGMMDFVGFDSAAPSVIADFSAGRI